MVFEWDEEKRLKNIEKHGIDFVDADILFGNPHLVAQAKAVDGEQRWLTGMIDEFYVTAVFSRRDPVCGVQEMEKEKGIRRFSETELEERRARGESGTALARVQAKAAKELERDIDSDFIGVPEDWHKRAEAVMPTPKKLLSLRLDSDVVDWFKKQGPGYQTRINAVLRVFVQQTARRRA